MIARAPEIVAHRVNDIDRLSSLPKTLGAEIDIRYPTEEDLVSTATLSMAGGKILPQEAKWLRNALRLNDIQTKDIMTPVTDIRRVPDKMTLDMTTV